MSDMYKDHLLDHARRPRNYGVLSRATHVRHEANPTCADIIDVYLIVEDGQIKELSFIGRGCVISQAATSVVLEAIVGKQVEDVLAISPANVMGWLGIEPGPMRMNCALLPLRAVYKALN